MFSYLWERHIFIEILFFIHFVGRFWFIFSNIAMNKPEILPKMTILSFFFSLLIFKGPHVLYFLKAE